MLYRTKTILVQADSAPEDGLWEISVDGKVATITDAAFQILFESLGQLQANLGEEVIVDIAGFDLSWCKETTDRNLINELLALEAISTDNAIDGQCWMFKPYPISAFCKLVKAVVDDTCWTWKVDITSTENAPRFLEVGCGPGTKLVVAEKLFGLDAGGFDYNPEYVKAANALLESKGCKSGAFVANAMNVTVPYTLADVIWLNRPFVNLDVQLELEKLVLNHMYPGSYIILANYVTNCAQLGWQIIAGDTHAVVLRKPVI